MKINTTYLITDSGVHCVASIPVGAGNWYFNLVVQPNGSEGSGANAGVNIGFGDLFVGNAGGPAATVLTNGLSQFASVNPAGGNLNGLPGTGSGMATGAPPILEIPWSKDIQTAVQAGSFTTATPCDVQIYVQRDMNDPLDAMSVEVFFNLIPVI